MLIDCKWCGNLIENDDPVTQDPDDGTPYHAACFEAMLDECGDD